MLHLKLFRNATRYSLRSNLRIRSYPVRQFVARGPQHTPEGEREIEGGKESGGGRKLALAGLTLSAVMGKAKYVLVALKLTKAAPLASMVLSSAAYSMIFGWPYACGMVGLIFFHECGHAIVMRHYGVPFSPMVFIPFMGAVISMEENPRNAYEEAMIAFGGPVVGTAAALGTLGVGQAMDSQLLISLADWGLLINLFNLLPIGSLDGGRIANAISPWIGVAGVAGGAMMVTEGLVHNPIFYLILATGAYSSVGRVWNRYRHGDDQYHQIPKRQQTGITAAYIALVVGLLVAMRENNKRKKSVKQLKQEQALNAYDGFEGVGSYGYQLFNVIDELDSQDSDPFYSTPEYGTPYSTTSSSAVDPWSDREKWK